MGFNDIGGNMNQYDIAGPALGKFRELATPADKAQANPMAANERQVGGSHYKGSAIEHWDIVAQHDLDYFQGQITKYVMRWRKKNGTEDLKKARHFLDKYIELAEAERAGSEPTRRYVDQDGRC
jgi:hypothetical protein